MWKSGKQIVNCCYCFREVLVCATQILSRLSLSGKSFSKCEKGGIHHIITQPLIQKLWKTVKHKNKDEDFFLQSSMDLDRQVANSFNGRRFVVTDFRHRSEVRSSRKTRFTAGHGQRWKPPATGFRLEPFPEPVSRSRFSGSFPDKRVPDDGRSVEDDSGNDDPNPVSKDPERDQPVSEQGTRSGIFPGCSIQSESW